MSRKKSKQKDNEKESDDELQLISAKLFKRSPKAYHEKIKDTRETSRGLARDSDEEDQIGEDDIIDPPYDLDALSAIISMSSELPQNIDAMKQNCEGYGYNLIPQVPEKEKKKFENQITEEANKLDDFFKYSSYQISFTKMRKNIREDLESIGNGYMEILRNEGKQVDGFEHIKAINMRLTQQDKDFTEVKIKKFNSQEYKYNEIKYKRRFRRYVQVINENKVFFKEFGDPRSIDARTGKEFTKEEASEASVNGLPFIAATEVYHFSLGGSESVYGLPRWIGTTPAIVGSRAMEETNVDWFHNKAIPPMVYMVSGGKLTKGAVDRIKEYSAAQVRGLDNYHKALILDAVGSGTPGSLEKNNVRIDIKELKQLKEGIFLEYDKSNQRKIRSSFRLPGIFVGATDDYTRATAKESKEVAEEQIFQPERADFDFFINRNIFPELDIKYHAFQTKSVPINNRKDETDLTFKQSRSGLAYKEQREKLDNINEVEIEDLDSDKVYMNIPSDLAKELLKSGHITLTDTMDDLKNGLVGIDLDEEEDEENEDNEDPDDENPPEEDNEESKEDKKTEKKAKKIIKLSPISQKVIDQLIKLKKVTSKIDSL
jgi:PBSX family phage portal protein